MIELTSYDIEKVVSVLPISVIKKDSDREFLCLCPFHEEKEPSFHISLKSNMMGVYNCFGCDNSGSIFKLAKDLIGQSVYSILGISPSKQSIFDRVDGITKIKKVKEMRVITDLDIIGSLKEIKDNRLTKTYARKRDISDKQIEDYNIKYLDDGYVGLKNLEYRHWSERIIIPIMYKNKIISYEGRDYTNKSKLNKKYPKCLYPIGSRTCDILFDLDKLDYTKELILVEGIMDLYKVRNALPFVQVSTAFGIQFSKRQRSLIKNFKKVSLMYDPDEGGERGIRDFIKYYKKDFNVCLLKNGDPSDSNYEEIKEAYLNKKNINDYLYLLEKNIKKVDLF